MKLAIISINFNNHKDTIALLESIANLRKKDILLTVFIVDNASRETSVQSVKSFIQKQQKKVSYSIQLIENKKNLGFSEGNNVGIRAALSKDDATDILLVNNDTLLDKDLLIELIAAAKDTIGIVSPKIYFAKGHEYHKSRYSEKEKGTVLWYAGGVIDWNNVIGFHRGVDEVDIGQYEQEVEVDFASGCCMFIRRDVVKRVGLLDEKYFLYYEDSDYSIRVKKVGYKIVYAPKAKMWHKNAGSAGGSGSSLQDYFLSRNRLLFGLRYAPHRSKIALLRESLSLLLNGRLWQKRGIRDFFLGRFGKGSFII